MHTDSVLCKLRNECLCLKYENVYNFSVLILSSVLSEISFTPTYAILHVKIMFCERYADIFMILFIPAVIGVASLVR